LAHPTEVPTPEGVPAPPAHAVPPPSVAVVASAFPQLEILECIRRGGMGVIYKVRQPRLDRLVALKLLPPAAAKDAAFRERFTREADSGRSFSSP
jgi:serine/threonine protein kinase